MYDPQLNAWSRESSEPVRWFMFLTRSKDLCYVHDSVCLETLSSAVWYVISDGAFWYVRNSIAIQRIGHVHLTPLPLPLVGRLLPLVPLVVPLVPLPTPLAEGIPDVFVLEAVVVFVVFVLGVGGAPKVRRLGVTFILAKLASFVIKVVSASAFVVLLWPLWKTVEASPGSWPRCCLCHRLIDSARGCYDCQNDQYHVWFLPLENQLRMHSCSNRKGNWQSSLQICSSFHALIVDAWNSLQDLPLNHWVLRIVARASQAVLDLHRHCFGSYEKRIEMKVEEESLVERWVISIAHEMLRSFETQNGYATCLK